MPTEHRDLPGEAKHQLVSRSFFVTLLSAAFAYVLLLSAGFLLTRSGRLSSAEGTILSVLFFLITGGASMVPCLLAAGKYKQSFSKLMFLHFPGWKPLLTSALAGMLLQLPAWALNQGTAWLLSLAGQRATIQSAARGLLLCDGVRERIFMLVPVLFLGPAAEEIAFRLNVYSKFRSFLSPFAATLITAFLFAAIHLNTVSFASLLLLGICFQLIFIKTKSLWCAVTMHVFCNFVSVILLFCMKTGGY